MVYSRARAICPEKMSELRDSHCAILMLDSTGLYMGWGCK